MDEAPLIVKTELSQTLTSEDGALDKAPLIKKTELTKIELRGWSLGLIGHP